MSEDRRQRAAGLFALLAAGFFALAAQTLLFREFFAAFEGHEFGVACFFTSWLVWVAAGAALARKGCLRTASAADRFELLALSYLPAFLLQAALIHGARRLAGIAPYELFPLGRLVIVSLAVNGPVSLVTGALFTIACRRFHSSRGLAVANVFMIEAIGGACGGVLVTLMLARGWAGETAFLWCASAPALAAACRVRFRGWRWLAALPLVAIAATLLAGADTRWHAARSRAAWAARMPSGSYGGEFVTPSARYRYGRTGEQFNVLAWEHVVDVVPATEAASATIALHLAQVPSARKFLVIGDGAYGICLRLLTLPQTTSVTWLDADPAYPGRLLAALPPALRTQDPRLVVPARDPRVYLRDSPGVYDAMILAAPPVATLAMSRLQTVEWFHRLRNRLAPGGVLGVRTQGGENVLGAELANVGATLYATLGSVFPRRAIKPGDDTWIMAGVDVPLTEKAGVLRDRFASVPGARALYPPDALLALFPPDRIAFQREAYARLLAERGAGALVNTDARPRALLHELLATARASGASRGWAALADRMAVTGGGLPFVAILLVPLLRLVFCRERSAARWRGLSGGAAGDRFAWGALVLTTGGVAMATDILLMFQYQSRFGVLFLHAGLVTALFMFGLALGSLLVERLLAFRPRIAVSGGIAMPVLHAALLVTLPTLPTALHPQGFALLFCAAGVLGGAYVPLAAAAYRRFGMASESAGSAVERLDNLGGATGGLVTGLLLLPVFGAAATAVFLASWLLSLVPLFALCGPEANASPVHGPPSPRDSVAAAAGYVLFGLTALAVVASWQLRPPAAAGLRLLRDAAQAMAPDQDWRVATQAAPDGSTFDCLAAGVAEDAPGDFAFLTQALAPDVVGYAGPVSVAVHVSADGHIRNLRIVQSRETPAYLQRVTAWLPRLQGLDIFRTQAMRGVDGVSGATITSRAVLRALDAAGPAFARAAGMSVTGEAPPPPARTLDVRLVMLGLFAVLAVVSRRWPSRIARRILLVAVIAVFGVWLNVQVAMVHVLNLLALRLPPLALPTTLFLVVGIPLLVACFGNVYCGGMCPFGALQELLGDWRPQAWRTGPDRRTWAAARFVKFGILALFVFLAAAIPDTIFGEADPLATVFSRDRTLPVTVVAIAMLVLAVPFGRFWCRVLCPTGAFLSLFTRLRLVRRLAPRVDPGRCPYGVGSRRELDCLACDRCRMPPSAGPALPATTALPSRVGIRACVLVTAAVGAIWLLARVATVPGGPWGRLTSPMPLAGGGEARQVDLPRLLEQIQAGRLSDHEAMFWEPVTNDVSGRAHPR